MNPILSCSLVALVTFAACTDPSVDDLGSAAQDLKSPCPSWGCGENSPILGPFDMHELDELGQPNSAGIVLTTFVKNINGVTVTYRADVMGDRLYARDYATGVVVLSGAALTGGYFVLSYPAKGTLQAGVARLYVTHVSSTAAAFWQGPATAVETYELKYTGAGNTGDPVAVCKNPPDAKAGVIIATDGEGAVWGNRFESILYTGDRYDADRKLVTASTPREAGTWFNIACAGSALAKLHLNRHTAASITTGYTTTATERQAMLKMYTGDFCGTGVAYTKQGTALHWRNDKGWQSPAGNTTSYESLWSSTGAVCMEVHRLASSLDPIEAGWGDDIRTECHMPKCSEFSWFPNLPSLVGTGQYLLTQSAAQP